MPNFSFLISGLVTALVLSTSCGTDSTASVCGADRPCVPEGTWVVSYDAAPGGQSFGDNTVRIDSDGSAEVVGETVPDNQCTPEDPTPGDLATNAELSEDGCTLAFTIDKSWCQSGEANCEERSVVLDFCNNGSTSVARGSMLGCVCWSTGSPFCDGEEDFVSVDATATRPR